MAKIRVHELAKKYDMPSAEVVRKLVAAGIEVKAAATAVDQTMADAALTGKKVPKPAENGGQKQQQRPRQTGDLGIR
ncbi:MAG TPA: translation initiation factor IF-2 N-terminal domain-containing protein, partial [Solirubrobacteraceae bacterium]|nr:translation initiation factor IF-2 N-terminal domain-containing protein [Solirubrobacteraceae bacterium]